MSIPPRSRSKAKALALACLVAVLTGCASSPRPLPPPEAPPFNQLTVSGNACGPAALLNAFRYGGQPWRKVDRSLTGSTDRQRLSQVLKTHGGRPSAQLAGRTRWSKNGINVIDLADLGNDLSRDVIRPRLQSHVFLPGSARSPHDTLRDTLHDTRRILTDSLNRGFPPVISIRRQVMRTVQGTPAWITTQNHFVTLIAIGEVQANRLPFECVDPWGGKRLKGAFIPSRDPRLGVEVEIGSPPLAPSSTERDEPSVRTLSAAVGRW